MNIRTLCDHFRRKYGNFKEVATIKTNRSNIRIATCNANGIIQRKNELKAFFNLEIINICLISETHLYYNDLHTLQIFFTLVLISFYNVVKNKRLSTSRKQPRCKSIKAELNGFFFEPLVLFLAYKIRFYYFITLSPHSIFIKDHNCPNSIIFSKDPNCLKKQK